MIVIRRADVDGFRPARRGLLGWLHSDGVLILPEDLSPPDGGGRDVFLEEFARALARPVES